MRTCAVPYRTASLLTALALLVLALGCSAEEEAVRVQVYQLYFQEADLSLAAGGGAFRTEPLYLDTADTAETLPLVESLMTALLNGPTDETLKSPIPAGTALLSARLQGDRALVDLSFPYNALSGMALTLADYAITLTLTQLPQVGSVQITVGGRELAYRNQQIFTARDALLLPEEDVVSTLEATLYFLNDSGLLTAELRTLDLYEGDTQVTAVAQALVHGPESRGLSPVLPDRFRVKSVWQEDEVCYVNLSSALLEELELQDSPQSLPLALQALGQSLCALEGISETRFLVDGEFSEQFSPIGRGEIR